MRAVGPATVVTLSVVAACSPRAQSGPRETGDAMPVRTSAAPPASHIRYFPSRGVLTVRDRPAVQFRIEIARTEAERARGLMFRPVVPQDTGMLFDMGAESIHAFWMRNTLASLDMLFLDRELRVVGLLRDVPTRNDLPRAVDAPSWYVLELAAGTAQRTGLGVGTQFKLRQTADGAADQPP